MRIAIFVALVVGFGGLFDTSSAVAAGKSKARQTVEYVDGGAHPKSGYYHRRTPRVMGFVQRRGGYSYSSGDVINTYSDNRSKYGSVNSYRDPMVDRQTSSGPFDHGFFFDSGIAPRGGNSPYLN